MKEIEISVLESTTTHIYRNNRGLRLSVNSRIGNRPFRKRRIGRKKRKGKQTQGENHSQPDFTTAAECSAVPEGFFRKEGKRKGVCAYL